MRGHAAVDAPRPPPRIPAGHRLRHLGLRAGHAAPGPLDRRDRPGGRRATLRRARTDHVRGVAPRLRRGALVAVAQERGAARHARRGVAGAGGSGPGAGGGGGRDLDHGDRLPLGLVASVSIARSALPISSRTRGASWRRARWLGQVLERATGMSVSEYMATRLWQPLGAEADGTWSLDSEDSGFEKMESGLKCRARRLCAVRPVVPA